MGYGWEGERVRLVPLDVEAHLENAMRWINDPEVSEWLAMGDYPMTRFAEREWLETRSKANREETSFAIETIEGQHIGFTAIHNIRWPDAMGLTGSLIGARDLWGQGYGTDAARVRTRYAFDVLGLRILQSEVYAGNDRSLRMLQRAGFVEFGRLPKAHWKRGEFRDAIYLYIDREMFRSGPQ